MELFRLSNSTIPVQPWQTAPPLCGPRQMSLEMSQRGVLGKRLGFESVKKKISVRLSGFQGQSHEPQYSL